MTCGLPLPMSKCGDGDPLCSFLPFIFFSFLPESEEVDRLMQCVKELGGSVNQDVLDTFLIEMGYQGHPPPITMAMDIAAALHEE